MDKKLGIEQNGPKKIRNRAKWSKKNKEYKNEAPTLTLAYIPRVSVIFIPDHFCITYIYTNKNKKSNMLTA